MIESPTEKAAPKLRSKPPFYCQVETAEPYEQSRPCMIVLAEDDKNNLCHAHYVKRPFWPNGETAHAS